jgi:hypothetical protein
MRYLSTGLILRIPKRASPQHPDEQPTGEGDEGDQTANAGGGSVPRWQQCVDPGERAAAAHRRNAVGSAAVSGHGADQRARQR